MANLTKLSIYKYIRMIPNWHRFWTHACILSLFLLFSSSAYFFMYSFCVVDSHLMDCTMAMMRTYFIRFLVLIIFVTCLEFADGSFQQGQTIMRNLQWWSELATNVHFAVTASLSFFSPFLISRYICVSHRKKDRNSFCLVFGLIKILTRHPVVLTLFSFVTIST